MNKKKLRRIANIAFFYYVPLLIWMGLIFYLSSIPGSPRVYNNPIIYIERKGAHIFEFFVLTILFFRIFRLHIRKGKTEILGWSVIGASLFAISDEIHQLFTPFRDGKTADLIFDLVGIILAVVVVQYQLKRLKKKQMRKTGEK